MKYIKPYKIFENISNYFPTTREEVVEVCIKFEIINYTINDDLSIDVDGDVDMANKGISSLPIKFGKVSGDFACESNYQFFTLEGCPYEVGGSFSCNTNELFSLRGCPKIIGIDFDCGYCPIDSLEGCPETVGGNFYCEHSGIESLEYMTKNIGGSIILNMNEIKSFKGCPDSIFGNLYISDNNITDLEYIPNVSDYIHLQRNPVHSIVNSFIIKGDDMLIEDFQDYDIIIDNKSINLFRLENFFKDFNLPMPDLKKIKKHYKIIE